MRWRLRQLAPEGNDPLGAMRCAQAATARMAKGLSVGGPGDSEDNCVERNAYAIRTNPSRRDGEWQLQSGAETSVVRNVHHAVLHSREDRFSPRFRRDLTAS